MRVNDDILAQRLAPFVARVASSVPRYYGFRHFKDFPVVEKSDIRDNVADFISEDIGAEKKRLVAVLGDEERQRTSRDETRFSPSIVIEETSGSSGISFPIPKTVAERVACAAGIWQFRRRFDPAVISRRFYPFVHFPAGFKPARPPCLFTAENIVALYESLTAAGITWVHGNPQILREHARLLSGRPSSIRFCESSGFFLDADTEKLIAKNMGVQVIDQYGCREVWVIGMRAGGESFSVNAANVKMEIVDATGGVIDQAGRPGRVVVTALHQTLFPFIRYATGDLAQWDEGMVGREFRLLPYREQNTIRIRGVQRSGNDVFKEVLVGAYRKVGHVDLSYIQIRQFGPDAFLLVLSPTPKGEQLRSTIETMFNAYRGHSTRAQFLLHNLTLAELGEHQTKKPALFIRSAMVASKNNSQANYAAQVQMYGDDRGQRSRLH